MLGGGLCKLVPCCFYWPPYPLSFRRTCSHFTQVSANMMESCYKGHLGRGSLFPHMLKWGGTQRFYFEKEILPAPMGLKK